MKSLLLLLLFLVPVGCMNKNHETQNFDQASEELVELIFWGLDYGVENIKIDGKGPLVPFVITIKNGEKKLSRFVSEHLEDGVQEGLNFLKNEKESRYGVIVYDGYITINGEKVDAVLVKGFDRQDSTGYVIAQRYNPNEGKTHFALIDNPAFIGNDEQILK